MSGEEAVPKPLRTKLAELRARNARGLAMEASDRLRKAGEYELLAASYSERAPFDPENGRAAVGFTLAALVLRELPRTLTSSSSTNRWTSS